MTDYFSTMSPGLNSPPTRAEVVDISTTDHSFEFTTRGYICSGAGNLKVDFLHGATGVTVPVLAGVQYSGRLTKVYKTGTTATGITGLS